MTAYQHLRLETALNYVCARSREWLEMLRRRAKVCETSDANVTDHKTANGLFLSHPDTHQRAAYVVALSVPAEESAWSRGWPAAPGAVSCGESMAAV
ncbi:hypothetical protein AALO_G00150010 [Alosa alosa]|uniref:Uncharacterized protein n=1 Tax=Alosa alosa TaxID=278164 RepID=A0AAV6GE07_9TELE|nr:hypothetical protein AALO_G00150010 [Alosa alosa]